MSVPSIARTCGPGRPKDLEKRAAILQAAKRLFTTQVCDGTRLDTSPPAPGLTQRSANFCARLPVPRTRKSNFCMCVGG